MTNDANPIDPQRWASMDPLVRSRFHELANHITRLEGVIAGLSMRVPDKPETVPVLAKQVESLERGQEDSRRQIADLDGKLTAKIEGIDTKLDALLLRIVGGTTVLTALATVAVNVWLS